jgi:hypothetical protein
VPPKTLGGHGHLWLIAEEGAVGTCRFWKPPAPFFTLDCTAVRAALTCSWVGFAVSEPARISCTLRLCESADWPSHVFGDITQPQRVGHDPSVHEALLVVPRDAVGSDALEVA